MALPGISNANEFYSAHYLESVLTGDIKKVRERWAEEAKAELDDNPLAEVSTPEQRFKALRKPWQKLREAELGISGDPAERLRLQRELFFQPLCEALGYPFTPRAEPKWFSSARLRAAPTPAISCWSPAGSIAPAARAIRATSIGRARCNDCCAEPVTPPPPA